MSPNKFTKTVHFAHPIAQMLGLCAAAYEWRWAFGKATANAGRQLAIATVVVMMSCASFAMAAAVRQEDFATFFERFASDSTFRLSRVSIPLIAMLDPTEVPRKEFAWSIEQVKTEMIAPLPKAKLGGLKEEVTHESEELAKVTQMEPESDVYRCSYYFRQTHGQWFLCRYEDTSL